MFKYYLFPINIVLSFILFGVNGETSTEQLKENNAGYYGGYGDYYGYGNGYDNGKYYYKRKLAEASSADTESYGYYPQYNYDYGYYGYRKLNEADADASEGSYGYYPQYGYDYGYYDGYRKLNEADAGLTEGDRFGFGIDGGFGGRGFGKGVFGHRGRRAVKIDKKLRAGVHKNHDKHVHAHHKAKRNAHHKKHQDIYFKKHIEFRHKKSRENKKSAHFDKKLDAKKKHHLKKKLDAGAHIKKVRGHGVF